MLQGSDDAGVETSQWEALRLRIGLLRERIRVCPRDLSTQSELASILERVGSHDVALAMWRRVLRQDSNNLKAWEGIKRCRLRLAKVPVAEI